MGIKQRNVDENGDGGSNDPLLEGGWESNGPLGGGKDQTAQKSRMGPLGSLGDIYGWLLFEASVKKKVNDSSLQRLKGQQA